MNEVQSGMTSKPIQSSEMAVSRGETPLNCECKSEHGDSNMEAKLQKYFTDELYALIHGLTGAGYVGGREGGIDGLDLLE